MSVRLSHRRVLLKISGEGLMGERAFGVDPGVVSMIARDVGDVAAAGVEVCLVIGGGNIFRGLQGAAEGMERTNADHMGMLATLMNALAMQNALEQQGIAAVVQSAIPMPTVCESFISRKALRHLEKGNVVIFAAGTGNPYFTTDTAAVLRAVEVRCDVMLKATQVDGVYSADPKKDSGAVRYDRLDYTEVLTRGLRVMDAAAIALARENGLPILVFNMHGLGAFSAVMRGEGLYTLIAKEK